MTDAEATEQGSSERIVLDTHADTPQRMLDEAWSFVDSPLGPGQLNLAAARAGGLHGGFLALWPEPDRSPGGWTQRTFALLDAVLQEIDRHPADLQLCRTAAEVREAFRAGRYAVLLGIEGGHAIGDSLPLLRTFFRLGVRYMTLTWSNTNTWADSSGDLDDTSIHHHGGLTPFGREVVHEMNRLGMLVDISHVSDATFADVLAISKAPVVATHSNARALAHHPRNLSDDMLRALAEHAGVAMTNLYAGFLSDPWMDQWKATAAERDHAHALAKKQAAQHGRTLSYGEAHAIDRAFADRIPKPPLSLLLDHIDHMIQVAGIDHVGFGSDFDGIPAAPTGLETAAGLPLLLAGLAHRGYTPNAITKIMGGNLLRVLEQARQHAAEPLQTAKT